MKGPINILVLGKEGVGKTGNFVEGYRFVTPIPRDYDLL